MTANEPDPLTAAAAEAEAAAAEARAEAARARADELRLRLRAAEEAEAQARVQRPEERPDEIDTSAATGVADAESVHPAARRTAVPLRAAGPVLAALVTAGLLAGSGYMLWQHRQESRERQWSAEYAAAARQGVINLMSIDYATAKDSVQRVLDGSTGRFRSNFADTAEDFVKALTEEKIVTKATVNDAAVESMTGDSAVVLVAATSRREGPQAPKEQQEPRRWRVVISLEREGGQIKMSGVEFV